jgi:Dolichyl-phosphate-mannose-protein mannosyltransferase
MRDHARIGYGCAAAALAIASALAYDAIPDLPLAPQSDEPKKAYFVLAGRQDFLQPLLLLQTVRLANLIARYTDQLAVVELGRTVAAVFGGLTVLATIVLARRVVGRALALGAGLIAAVTPLIAFHAQLLKEDIFLAPWLLFALAALDRLRESVELRRALLFGITVGLAASAKYIGAVLLPVACALPLIAPVAGTSLRRYYATLAWSAGAAIAVFALVNAPAFLTPDIFLHGLGTEIAHAVTKHIIVWPGWYSHFLFHWTTSLWPGLGPALAVAGLAGALLVVADWRASPPAIRLVLVFAVLWYLLHELSPMKPFMAIERHMTVMGGLFAVLAVHLADRLSVRGPRTWQTAIATAIVAIAAAPAALSTIAIARSAPNDTRSVVERVRAALDGPDAVDWYATFPASGHYPPLTTIKETTDYVVIVQETADRFAQSRAFAHQSDPARAYARAYGELLAQPAILVESTAGNFSYRNVPLRVVALGSNAARLAAVLAKLGPLPQTRLTLVPGRDDAAQARAAVDAAQAFRQMVQ